MKAGILSVFVFLLALSAAAQQSHPLRDVTTVQVDPTVVPNPDEVKSDSAPGLVQDILRGTLRDAGFTVGEAPVRAHIVLDKFTSGNMAKRFFVGFGAGRSTLDAHLVIRDAKDPEGKDLASVRFHVRGNMILSPYEGGKTQRRQAVSGFQQRLLEEIEKLK